MNAGSPWAADGDQDVEHQCFSAQAERHKINQDGHANSLGGKFHLACGNAKNLGSGLIDHIQKMTVAAM